MDMRTRRLQSRPSSRWISRLAGVVAMSIVVSCPTPQAQAHTGGSPLAAVAASASYAGSGPCPDASGSGVGWDLSATRFDNSFGRHAFVGNGYLGQRVPPAGMGYFSTGEETGWPLFTPRYDGAVVAGLHAQDPSLAGGRTVIAAIPTWSTLNVVVGGETFTAATPADRISDFRQTLHMRCGLLRTALTWTTGEGLATRLVYDVFADRVRKHVGAVRLSITPQWSGNAAVTDLIDGAGARRLTPTGGGPQPGGLNQDVTFRTQTTGTAGAVASTLRPGLGIRVSDITQSPAEGLSVSQSLAFDVDSGRSYEVVKYVGVDTELTADDPQRSASAASQEAADLGWSALFADHVAAWAELWRSDIVLPSRPDLQEWLRSGIYGLLSSSRSDQYDSVSPVGLTSDNYAGLIFWDAETWIYPGLLALFPDIARAMLEYRFRTLPGAQGNAARLGYEGAFYPWTSAGHGDLPTECHSVDPPHCFTQIHLQGDIAIAVWQYYQATGDKEWLRTRGWPILDNLARFWAGRVTPNDDGSYSILNVAGPDEYSNGVHDGAYTNAVAATTLRHANEAARILGEAASDTWTTIADQLRMPFDPQRQVFMQYDGYDGSLIKQADTVLTIYPVEWPMSAEVAANTLNFYAEHTDADGPAMTDSVHAIVSASVGEPGCATHTYLMRSIAPFVRDPFAQVVEARGDKAGADDPLAGAPAYNFLTAEGGFLQVFTNGLTGLRWRTDQVHLDPLLPPQLGTGVTLHGVHWQGRTFDITVGPDQTTVQQTHGQPFTVESPDGAHVASVGQPLSLKTRRPDLVPTDNLARCRPAASSGDEPGMYAEAAVDGTAATLWAPPPAATDASLTVDLTVTDRITRIAPTWTGQVPATHQFLVSLDGTSWTAAPATGADGNLVEPVTARHIRIDLTRNPQGDRTGLRELEVTAAEEPSPTPET
jgi:trehalose/maltose hydrolase-like predicted phosphorylase